MKEEKELVAIGPKMYLRNLSYRQRKNFSLPKPKKMNKKRQKYEEDMATLYGYTYLKENVFAMSEKDRKAFSAEYKAIASAFDEFNGKFDRVESCDICEHVGSAAQECVMLCDRGKNCQNSPMYNNFAKDLEVYTHDNPEMGQGLRTRVKLPGNEPVIEFKGEISSSDWFKKQWETWSEKKREMPYFYEILGGQLILDPTSKGNLARFINHSCNANCVINEYDVASTVRLRVTTTRPLEENEPLTVDYGDSYSGDFLGREKEPTKCLCQEDNCRGYIMSKEKIKKLFGETVTMKNGPQKRTSDKQIKDTTNVRAAKKNKPKPTRKTVAAAKPGPKSGPRASASTSTINGERANRKRPNPYVEQNASSGHNKKYRTRSLLHASPTRLFCPSSNTDSSRDPSPDTSRESTPADPQNDAQDSGSTYNSQSTTPSLESTFTGSPNDLLMQMCGIPSDVTDPAAEQAHEAQDNGADQDDVDSTSNGTQPTTAQLTLHEPLNSETVAALLRIFQLALSSTPTGANLLELLPGPAQPVDDADPLQLAQLAVANSGGDDGAEPVDNEATLPHELAEQLMHQLVGAALPLSQQTLSGTQAAAALLEQTVLGTGGHFNPLVDSSAASAPVVHTDFELGDVELEIHQIDTTVFDRFDEAAEIADQVETAQLGQPGVQQLVSAAGNMATLPQELIDAASDHNELLGNQLTAAAQTPISQQISQQTPSATQAAAALLEERTATPQQPVNGADQKSITATVHSDSEFDNLEFLNSNMDDIQMENVARDFFVDSVDIADPVQTAQLGKAALQQHATVSGGEEAAASARTNISRSHELSNDLSDISEPLSQTVGRASQQITFASPPEEPTDVVQQPANGAGDESNPLTESSAAPAALVRTDSQLDAQAVNAPKTNGSDLPEKTPLDVVDGVLNDIADPTDTAQVGQLAVQQPATISGGEDEVEPAHTKDSLSREPAQTHAASQPATAADPPEEPPQQPVDGPRDGSNPPNDSASNGKTALATPLLDQQPLPATVATRKKRPAAPAPVVNVKRNKKTAAVTSSQRSVPYAQAATVAPKQLALPANATIHLKSKPTAVAPSRSQSQRAVAPKPSALPAYATAAKKNKCRLGKFRQNKRSVEELFSGVSQTPEEEKKIVTRRQKKTPKDIAEERKLQHQKRRNTVLNECKKQLTRHRMTIFDTSMALPHFNRELFELNEKAFEEFNAKTQKVVQGHNRLISKAKAIIKGASAPGITFVSNDQHAEIIDEPFAQFEYLAKIHSRDIEQWVRSCRVLIRASRK